MNNVLELPLKGDGRAFVHSEHALGQGTQPLAGGGEPPDNGSMLEERVAHLEQDMSQVKEVLGRLEPMIARIDERTKHTVTKEELQAVRGDVAGLSATIKSLPGRGFTIATVIAIVALVIATIAMVPAIQQGIAAF